MIDKRKVTAIILVAGNSTRYGQNRNKNFEIVNGKAVLAYSINQFDKNEYIDNIIVASKQEEIPIVKEIIEKEKIIKKVSLIIGGNTRKESVYNCITATDSDIVIIHDGARPAVKQEYINKCIESMNEFKGVTIGVKSKDTIKITDDNGIVINSTKRSNTWIIQTPQCFDRKILLNLHKKYENEDTLTIIAGYGEEYKYLNELKEELKLKNIVFLGNKDADSLREIYNISNVCAVPSRQEAFGLVALESIACGTPVVASNQGGIPDFITEDVGILIEKENIEQLSNAIIKILNKEKKYNQRKLSKYAKKNYRQDVLIDKLIDVYKSALS